MNPRSGFLLEETANFFAGGRGGGNLRRGRVNMFTFASDDVVLSRNDSLGKRLIPLAKSEACVLPAEAGIQCKRKSRI